MPAVSLPQHIGDQCLVHAGSPHVATHGTSNSVWTSRVHMPAVLSVGEVLVAWLPPQIGCSDGTSARPSTCAGPRQDDFRIRFSTTSFPLLLLRHHRWVEGTQEVVLVLLSPHSRHALTHTLSHTLMYARRHSKHSRTARSQLSTNSPHLLFDATQHRANGHAAQSLRSDEIASTDLGLLRHTRATPETPSAVRSKM